MCIVGFSLNTVSSKPINAKVTNIGDSVGTLRFTSSRTTDIYREEWVNPGETISFTFDINNPYKLSYDLRFHSVGRSFIYDAVLYNLDDVNHDFSLIVVFYKETGYYNKIITPSGPQETINYNEV
jgi:hypothetical protein